MINMKRKVEDNEVSLLTESDGPKEEYPWGLRISLDKDTLDKLGLNDLPEIGKVFTLNTLAKVIEVSQSSSADDNRRSVELQITDMEIAETKENGISLYKNSNMN